MQLADIFTSSLSEKHNESPHEHEGILLETNFEMIDGENTRRFGEPHLSPHSDHDQKTLWNNLDRSEWEQSLQKDETPWRSIPTHSLPFGTHQTHCPLQGMLSQKSDPIV
jgi:hypothetical protein